MINIFSFVVICKIFGSPLHSEVDEGAQLGYDSTPDMVPETAYINPFSKKSIRKRNDPEPQFQAMLQSSLNEDDDDAGIDAPESLIYANESDLEEEDEEFLTPEEIESMHLKKSGGNSIEGISRCNLNKNTNYSIIKGTPIEDELENAKFLSVESYLCKFGYLEDGVNLTEALKNFQRFIKVDPTGIVDETTLKLMKLPRCGDNDKRTPVEDRKRKKRWANSNRKWGENKLLYYIAKYTNDMPRKLQRNEMQRAFEAWGEVAPIEFKSAKRYKRDVNLVLSFQYYYHRDEFSFDGTGGELAHAFLPEMGVVHFDDSEFWTSNKEFGINLYSVAAHEIGHSLGLEHTSKRGALMSPFYDNFSTEKALNPDDIVSIQNLYGSRGQALKYHCPKTVRWDTAFSDSVSGFTYAFRGEQVWKFDRNGLMDSFPKLAINIFYGLPSTTVDASVAFKTGHAFIFAGDKYWKYNATTGYPVGGYPKSIALWGLQRGIRINDVIRWPRNNYVYFFTTDKYYRYNSAVGQMDPGYPQPLYLWQGVPSNMDSAMTSIDGGYTFFFLYHYYFPFNNRKARVEKEQIQQIKYSFFLCQETVTDGDEDRARFLVENYDDVNKTVNDENWKRFKSLEIDFLEARETPDNSSTRRYTATHSLTYFLLLLYSIVK